MKELREINNPYHKVIDACSLFGMMDISAKRFSGEDVVRAIAKIEVNSG